MIKKKEKAPFLVLLMIDGWGVAPSGAGNIFSLIKTPNYQGLIAKYPAAVLSVSPKQKKSVSRSDNYFTIGTGNFLQRKSKGLLENLKEAGIKTLTIFDQERYPEMNFFFSGRKKNIEDNFLIFKDTKGKGTTGLIAEALIKTVKKGGYGFITAVFSDLDIATTRGDVKASGEAAEKIDDSLKKITKIILGRGGLLIITAPAGKAEAIINPRTETVNKKTTSNSVPFVLIGKKYEGQAISFFETPGNDLTLAAPIGDISGIAPTILKIFFPGDDDRDGEKSFI